MAKVQTELQTQQSDNINVLTDGEMSDYTFSQEELEEYACYVGIDLEMERDLLWVAAEGLVAVPPEPWKACQSEGESEVFFFNSVTGESVWDHPCDELTRQKVIAEREKRALVPITLSAQLREDGWLISGVTLAGTTVCQAMAKAPESADFAGIEDELRSTLKLPEGAVPRFVLRDATMLGHSSRSRHMTELFAVAA
jgi:hypothetical protein